MPVTSNKKTQFTNNPPSTGSGKTLNDFKKRDAEKSVIPITLDGVYKKVDSYRDDFVKASIKERQDPLYLTFGLRFEFFPRIGESESLSPGLLTGAARDFLNSRNDTLRIQKLDYFTRQLQKFSIEQPWFFQTLSGVDKLMSFDISKGSRSAERKKITIAALETVDMKFMAFIDAYQSLIYDKKYMREVLPINTKRFDMSIYLMDPRNLVKRNKSSLELDEDSQGVIVIKCYDCEFHFDDFSTFTSSINNSTIGDPRSHSFGISVGRIYDTYNLPTGALYGYGGIGYYSDDRKTDYNFLRNLIRPESRSFAEIGNHQKVEIDKYDVSKSITKNPKQEAEIVLEEDQKQELITLVETEPLFVEESSNTIEITGIEPKGVNIITNIERVIPTSNRNITEISEIEIQENNSLSSTLNTEILQAISNGVRTVINE